ncbi:MAG: hypothetical protein U1B30_08620 [Pseudomonadota bacterium]|nr:hypothetical protein [Pseudomonadota bacterium]
MNFESVSRSTIVFVMMLAMSVSTVPVASAEVLVSEPLAAPAPGEGTVELLPPPLEAREPIPAPDPRMEEAKRKMEDYLKALNDARKETDAAKRKAALDAAAAELKKWNDRYKDLRDAAAEADARKIQNKELNDLLDLELGPRGADGKREAAKGLVERVQTIKDPKLQQLIWQGYLLRLQGWRDKYCTKEGQPKETDKLFTTMLNCDNIMNMIRRVEAKISMLQAIIDGRFAMVTPSPVPTTPVAYVSTSSVDDVLAVAYKNVELQSGVNVDSDVDVNYSF